MAPTNPKGWEVAKNYNLLKGQKQPIWRSALLSTNVRSKGGFHDKSKGSKEPLALWENPYFPHLIFPLLLKTGVVVRSSPRV